MNILKMLKRGWQLLCSAHVPVCGLNLTLLTSTGWARPRHWLPTHQITSMPVTTMPTTEAVVAMAPAVAASPGVDWGMRLFSLAIGVLAGALVGAFFSHRMRRLRRYLLLGAFGLAALVVAGIGITASDRMSQVVGAVVGAIATWMLLREASQGQDDTTLGSARWADITELHVRGIVNSK